MTYPDGDMSPHVRAAVQQSIEQFHGGCGDHTACAFTQARVSCEDYLTVVYDVLLLQQSSAGGVFEHPTRPFSTPPPGEGDAG